MNAMIRWAAAIVALAHTTAFGHGQAPQATARVYDATAVETTAFGREGNPRHVTRTVQVHMTDAMRFERPELFVKRGETVRLVVRNRGQMLHELVLGTGEDLARHADLMRRFPGMDHAEPYMAHVKPQASGEIVWQFSEAGEIQFACLLPGHLEPAWPAK